MFKIVWIPAGYGLIEILTQQHKVVQLLQLLILLKTAVHVKAIKDSVCCTIRTQYVKNILRNLFLLIFLSVPLL